MNGSKKVYNTRTGHTIATSIWHSQSSVNGSPGAYDGRVEIRLACLSGYMVFAYFVNTWGRNRKNLSRNDGTHGKMNDAPCAGEWVVKRATF